MNSVVNHLDSLALGENGALAYRDSAILSSLVAFDFKAMRGMDSARVEEYLDKMIQESGVETVFRHCAFVRDITSGKGERDVYYSYIYSLWKRYPEAVREVIPLICNYYGSWRDLKNLFSQHESDSGFVDMLTDITVARIGKDLEEPKSLLAKYLPGEKSSCKKFASIIAKRLYGSSRKRMALYRKMKSDMTKKLNIVERNLCANTRDNIECDKIPARALKLYLNTFLNLDKKGQNVRSQNEGRVAFALKFKDFLDSRKRTNKNLSSRGIEIRELVRDIVSKPNQIQEDVVESFVADMRERIGERCRVIPIIDTSGSMYDREMSIYAALGLGILLSMNTQEPFRNRFITFSKRPEWFVCDEGDSFVERIQESTRASWGANTNYWATLSLILDAFVSAKLPASETKDFVLAVFSDMQFDESSKEKMGTVMSKMKTRFAKAGIEAVGEPYEVPTIVFWNLRAKTTTTPVQSNEEGVITVSGFNQNLMKAFIENPSNINPEKMLRSVLHSNRYNHVGDRIREILN